MSKHVLIVGLMGVGKSSTGRALAVELGRPYVDSDADIETLFGSSGGAIAEEFGVPRLHEVEAGLVFGALSGEVPSVITAAASIVENPLVLRAAKRKANVVRLTLPLDEIITRQQDGSHRRPMELDELKKLAERRETLFAEIADIEVDTARPTDVLVGEIISALNLGTIANGR